jgi:hypothetical protein
MRTNEDDKKIEKQTNLDRHGLRPIANVCHIPDPTCFSLQTTLNSHIFQNFRNLLKANFQKVDTAEGFNDL